MTAKPIKISPHPVANVEANLGTFRGLGRRSLSLCSSLRSHSAISPQTYRILTAFAENYCA